MPHFVVWRERALFPLRALANAPPLRPGRGRRAPAPVRLPVALLQAATAIDKRTGANNRRA